MAKITLKEWNVQYFARPRTSRQLTRYIRDAKIFPRPIKIGREYQIESYAILLDSELINNPLLLKERINEQTKRSQN